MSEREVAIRQRLKDDFPHYAPRCLRIRPKDPRAGNQPFELNKAQLYLHERIESQRAETGKVRALVLKGRQQGISTYIGGRFYWRTSHGKGIRCFILTHEQDATDNLFAMVERYHENCPVLVKPNTGASNAKELYFDVLESGYAVGTAGTKAVGRSQTIQLLHGSEVAFWPHASTHFAGLVQAVPDLPGTEVLLESTANGVGGEFHERWQQAEAGIGDYIAVFVPWYWQGEYRRPVPPGFELTDEERLYKEAYGLTDEQMAWRRNKTAELKDPVLFMQEYPATAAEAFQMSGHDSFIPSELVLRARKATCAPSGPHVIGYDPAWKGSDRHSMAHRRGRKVLKIESRSKLDTMQGAGWAKQVLDANPDAVMFIDVGGVGAGVYDRLVEMSYGDRVKAVNFGGAPLEPQPLDENGRPKGGYLNRRAEMWGNSRDWLMEPAGVDIPDSDALQADACAPGYKYDSLTRVQIESKDDIRKRGLRSPDEWDAVALTFAEPVTEAQAAITYPKRAYA
ncbi:MAG: hypothetical protein IT537_25290 [Hyphomicrobiales bacterium]|nr:hypothetical protein [Hyphomicrobiales bacterium]